MGVRTRTSVRLNRKSYLVTASTTFVLLLAAWWLLSLSGVTDSKFLPAPVDVLQALGRQAVNGELAADITVSFYRILTGFTLATVMALPLGTLMGVNSRAEAALEPLMDFIRYMPVVAFVPLTIVWAGIDEAQKFLIIWLGTFFQQVLMVADAVRRTPPDMLRLGETLGFTRFQLIARIVVPGALPRIWDALRVTLGWAWTWLVVAELVAAKSGMGFRITVAQRFFATDIIIAYVFVLGVLGLVLDQIARALGRRFFAYRVDGA